MKAMRREIEGSDVAAAPVVSDCGRSASMLSTGLPGMTPNPPTIWASCRLDVFGVDASSGHGGELLRWWWPTDAQPAKVGAGPSSRPVEVRDRAARKLEATEPRCPMLVISLSVTHRKTLK